jgi:hypothetical protein
MRRPSRLLPRVRRKRVPLLGWALLCALVAGFAYALWRQPLLTAGLVLLVCGVSASHWLFVRRHLRRLAAVRTGEDIGVFAKQFDYRNVDTWVIRAVYEELQEYLGSEVNAFPLRASDRLSEDLKVDQGDLEDVVASRVAERTGRSHEAATSNPFYGKVHTVSDLVHFFNAQPRGAET